MEVTGYGSRVREEGLGMEGCALMVGGQGSGAKV
jgi:hypothetical protein